MRKTSERIGESGAILDEYEKAIAELKDVITPLSSTDIQQVVDTQTKDKDCVSIQSILTHVVESGYTYVIEIRKWLGEKIDYRKRIYLTTAEEYRNAFDEMFAFNEQLFVDHPNLKFVECDREKTIIVRWGQNYDVDQLMEHAIVHILRHRRQIENFIPRLKK